MLHCKKCHVVATPSLSWQATATGIYLRADCPSCGRYIKWVDQQPNGPDAELVRNAPPKPEGIEPCTMQQQSRKSQRKQSSNLTLFDS